MHFMTALRAAWQSRNNALIALGLQQGSLQQSLAQLVERFGSARIGVVMGSSTSSIDRSEEAYRQLDAQGQLPPQFLQEQVLNPHAPGLFVAELLGLDGPNMTVNTACSSSAKVFTTAARWLRAGIVDAVLVGGADTLCQSVLYGFHSLQLVSESPCRPFDGGRDGINLGEAAGFALLVRGSDAQGIEHTGIQVSGRLTALLCSTTSMVAVSPSDTTRPAPSPSNCWALPRPGCWPVPRRRPLRRRSTWSTA